MSDMTIQNNVNTYAAAGVTAATEAAAAAKTDASAAAAGGDTAAVYEKSTETTKSSTAKLYNKDAIVSKLKADQESRIASMQSLVEKLLNKQKGTFDLANSVNLADTFRQAAALASPEDIQQAQEDIGENGYWGVEQTSDRLVSMAIALSGGDTEKADLLKDAITKGFEKATKAWGEELPQLCKDTYDTTLKKMDDWKNGVTTAENYANYLS